MMTPQCDQKFLSTPSHNHSESKRKKSGALKWGILTLGMVILILGGIGGIIYVTRPTRWETRIDELINQNALTEAAALSEHYIRHIGINKRITQKWWHAEIQLHLMSWEGYWENGDWDNFRESVRHLKKTAAQLNISDVTTADFILWALDAEEYLRHPSPKVLFSDEYRIIELLKKWDDIYKNILPGQRILKGAPLLKTIEKTAFSRKHLLDQEHAVYVKKVMSITKDAENGIKHKNIPGVQNALKKYERFNFSGIERFKEDIELWRSLLKLIEQKRMLHAWNIIRTSTFNTQVFQNTTIKLRDELALFSHAANAFPKAQKAWYEGHFTESITRLKVLAQETQDADIQAELTRQKELTAEHKWLTDNIRDQNYPVRLVKFYRRLDETHEPWLIKTYTVRYKNALVTLEKTATARVKTGKNAWRKYMLHPPTAEDIKQVLRRKHFYKMARLLVKARDAFLEASELYALLSKTNKSLPLLLSTINEEIKRQQSQIDDARFLMKESIYSKMTKALNRHDN